MLRSAISNEPDRDRRQRLEEARLRLTDEQLNPVYLEAARIDRDAVQQLGAPNYYELYKRFGFRLDELADGVHGAARQHRAAVGAGRRQAAARAARHRALRRAAVGHRRASSALPNGTRLPPDEMVPALRETLARARHRARSQENVHLDLEQRPNKHPRAFCAPIEVPGRVMLVIAPIGGRDDWEALFHEAGHAEHYGFTSADLPMEDKRLGDMAVTEGWASLFQHLVTEPAWLNRRLDVPRVEQLANEGAVSLLYFARRYSAKLLYEIEFFQADDPASMRPRYQELLTEALKLPANAESYLDDIDGSFYVIGYLRSWAFEAHLRDFLRSEYGNEWFARREAGGLLRELWSLGQGPTADELLREVTGADLEMAVVAERIREGLAA